jgi:protein TonB
MFTPEVSRTSLKESLRIALSAEPRCSKEDVSSPLLTHWNSESVSRAQWLSLLAHAAIALSFVIPLAYQLDTLTLGGRTPRPRGVDLSQFLPYLREPFKAEDKARGGGGGGDRNPIPASAGQVPRFTLQPQLAPPQVVIQNPNARMSVESTLFGPPDIKIAQPNLPNYGDPLAKMLTDSSGPGSESGIGTGSRGGVGPDSGPGLGPGEDGGFGGKRFHPGANGVGYPQCVYCPNPPYTEEARKARFQGAVLLEILILPDGRASEVRVLRGLGMGLDESALQTVRTWRFKPVIGPGNRPVAVLTPVEVNFRLF